MQTVFMKLLRRILLSLIIFSAIAFGLVMTFGHMLNPDSLRTLVSNRLTRITGQPVQIKGSADWQFLPHPAILLSQIEIGNTNDANHASIKNLIFKLQLSALIHGQLVFNNIQVEGLKANIDTTQLSALKQSISTDKMHAKSGQNTPFSIDNLLLKDAFITLRTPHQNIRLKHLQLAATAIDFQRLQFPVQFKTTVAIYEANKTLFSSFLQFKGNTRLANETDLNGQLLAKNLVWQNLHFNRVNTHLHANKDSLVGNPLSIKAYNGDASGDASFSIGNGKLFLNLTANALDSSTLSRDLFGQKLLSGPTDLSLHSESDLFATNWLEQSKAKGNFSIKNGRLETIDLNAIVNSSNSKINAVLNAPKQAVQFMLDWKKTLQDVRAEQGTTPFNWLNLTFHLQQMHLYADNFILDSHNIQLKGQAETDLSNDALKGTLLATITNSSFTTTLAQQILGGGIPLIVKGTLAQPIVIPDINLLTPLLSQGLIKNTVVQPIKLIQKGIKLPGLLFGKHHQSAP